ncbi:hypothetical protein PORY_001340 [Pneumocystis oryctolagi]|uniref:Uncharacterized protein n=1 Tax=Pneumocystis oryctolagi TaxID=42067 RepID=A0ACB7CDN4_9ASCO|nr:hypothetical protein PORY_001340 [Pneumocystis oryctolagi]
MNFYDEIEIEDFTFDAEHQIYHYPCPCGDRFEISLDDLRQGEDIAYCPSCSLMVRVIYDQDKFIENSEEFSTTSEPIIKRLLKNNCNSRNKTVSSRRFR